MSAASRSSVADRPLPVGAPPADPERRSPSEWKQVVVRAGKAFVADKCMAMSQQIAYSALLAFFPAVAFVLGLLGILGLYDEVQTFIASVAPHGVVHFIEGLQRDSNGSAASLAFVVGLIGATWAASGAMSTLVGAVNVAYDCVETRPLWKVRLLSVLLVGLTALVAAATLVLVIFGAPLGAAISRKAHLGAVWDVSWAILRWPVTFVAVLLFFSLVYYLAPNLRQRSWKWITPGALVGALSWLALSALLALYVTFAGSYTKTYGAIASGVVLLLWLNYSAWAILFGAELNAELDRRR
jgi:membrane protein